MVLHRTALILLEMIIPLPRTTPPPQHMPPTSDVGTGYLTRVGKQGRYRRATLQRRGRQDAGKRQEKTTRRRRNQTGSGNLRSALPAFPNQRNYCLRDSPANPNKRVLSDVD